MICHPIINYYFENQLEWQNEEQQFVNNFYCLPIKRMPIAYAFHNGVRIVIIISSNWWQVSYAESNVWPYFVNLWYCTLFEHQTTHNLIWFVWHFRSFNFYTLEIYRCCWHLWHRVLSFTFSQLANIPFIFAPIRLLICHAHAHTRTYKPIVDFWRQIHTWNALCFEFSNGKY